MMEEAHQGHWHESIKANDIPVVIGLLKSSRPFVVGAIGAEKMG